MKEADIRPREITDRYLELSIKDACKMDRSHFLSIDCPACLSRSYCCKLQKNGFDFQLCQDCGSLFCSPRPDPEILNLFYESGESAEYWANVFFPAVAELRREKLFRTKAAAIVDLLRTKGISAPTAICDVGAGYGIFLEELSKYFPEASLHAIEPSQSLAAVCRKKGFETLESNVEDAKLWEGRFDLVISSEVLEHVYSPEAFVRSLSLLCRPDGHALVTCLGYDGFDILVLQEKSKAISPPHHLNFLSVKGLSVLFRRGGFQDIEVTTPGLLDVDIVLNSGSAPEFLKALSKREGAISDLQTLLQKHKLSSHVWILGGK